MTFFPSKKYKYTFMKMESEITPKRHAHTKCEVDVIKKLNLLTSGWANCCAPSKVNNRE